MGQIYRAKGRCPQTQQHHAQGGQYAAQGQQAGGSFHGFTSFPLYHNIGAGGAATEKKRGRCPKKLALHCGKFFLRRKSGGVTVVRDDCHVWRNLTPMKPAAAAQVMVSPATKTKIRGDPMHETQARRGVRRGALPYCWRWCWPCRWDGSGRGPMRSGS